MSIRSWLERHNIYFQVVAAILLSAMSLLVGYLQYVVSQEQLKLAEMEQSPLVVVKVEREVDESKQIRQIIDVDNVRGHIFDVQCRLDGLASIAYEPAEQTEYVKIDSIYDWRYNDGVTQGRLVRFILKENEVKDQWYCDTIAIESRAKYQYRCSQRRILTVAYSDFKGRQSEIRYEIHPTNGANRLDEPEARQIAENLRGATVCKAKRLNFDRLIASTFGKMVHAK